MLANIFVLISTNVSSFIDNIAISQLLGTQALAAAGLFSPVVVAAGSAYVIIFGVQILCGNFIGSGKRDKVNALFLSCFVTLGVVFAGLSLLSFIFCSELAFVLGARGNTHTLLCSYMAGFLPSIAPNSLAAMLISLASYNSDLKRSYLGTGVMIVVNAAGDLLMAAPLGIFGIGLASTISSCAALVVLLPGYTKREHTLHFERTSLDLRLVGQAVLRGLPFMMMIAGVVVKSSLLNYSMITYAGDDGVAVACVLNSVCAVTGAFPCGAANAYATLAGLYFGEEDRTSLIELFRISAGIGVFVCTFMTVVAAVSSYWLASLFFASGTAAWSMGQHMLLFGVTFLPFNFFYNLLLKSYQAQGRMTLVNIMSFIEPSMVGLCILLTVPLFGADAAWLANTWVDIACIGIVLVSVAVFAKKIDFSVPTLMKLPDGFGASPEECAEYSIATIEDVCSISQKVIDFCKMRGGDPRKAMYAGLCVEEIGENVVQYGMRYGPGSFYSADVRVVVREDITIRIRDNCREFDPRTRLELFDPESPLKNIGIRLVAQVARQMDYYNNAGINTLLLKI
jgi:Na+-driven multidrug efflux pump